MWVHRVGLSHFDDSEMREIVLPVAGVPATGVAERLNTSSHAGSNPASSLRAKRLVGCNKKEEVRNARNSMEQGQAVLG